MRKNQNGSVGSVEIGLIAVLLLFSGFVVWRITEADQTANDTAVENINVSSPIINNSESTISETTQPAPGEEPIIANAQDINLEAVNGYDASGVASRAFNDSGFTHEVIMTAPAPAEGKFYEGWIVGPSVISTGEFTNEDGDEWSLSFTSDEDLSEYTRVVITEETLADGLDGKPETHVLEGTFTN